MIIFMMMIYNNDLLVINMLSSKNFQVFDFKILDVNEII